MTWFRVDDNLAFHPKALTAGNAALGLWVRAGSWGGHQLCDGFIPDPVARALGTPNEIKRLVSVGLWEKAERDGEAGYLFHDWHDRNPSRAQVEEERRYNATRTALHRDTELVAAIKQRDGDRCRYCAVNVDWKNRRGPTGATYDHIIPGSPNTLDGIVVACRSCNSRKGQRTPEEAGMDLLPPRSLGSDSYPDTDQIRSGSVQDPDPTRPDPTQMVGRTTSPPLAARPSPFCPRHPTGTDQPCRSCADARRTADAWTPPPPAPLPDARTVLTERICPDHGGIVGRCPGCRRGLAPTLEETHA